MSIPKEPRQLMINLMYLVLTALLALNVSAEIFNAFFQIDQGLEVSNNVFKNSNDFSLRALEAQAKQNPEKYGPYVEVAKRIQEISGEFNGFVEVIKDSLVDISGGMYPEDFDRPHLAGKPIGYKNHDITTLMLVKRGQGEELKRQVLADREKIITEVRKLEKTEQDTSGIDPDKIEDLVQSLSLNISDDWENVDRPVSWSHFTFNHMPVGSVLPILSKFQNDMKASEAAVLNFLVQNMGLEAIKVDAFIPIASAEKSYVISGEKYKADITIGASSKSVYDNMTVRVNGREYEVDNNGVAEYEVGTSGTGVKKYEVEIDIVNPTTGKKETYSSEFAYEVGRRSVTVSADKMNVFYIGVDNPVSVSAAGVSSNELRVNGQGGGLKLKPNGVGKYIANVSKQGDAKVIVSGGGLQPTSFDFRVKRIPNPVARLGNKDSESMGAGTFKALCLQSGIIPWLDNFDFEAKCRIVDLSLNYAAPRQDIVVRDKKQKGNGRLNEFADVINRAKAGDTFYIDDIRAKCPGDKGVRKVNSLVFRIR